MPSNDSDYQDVDPAKYPTPAPGTGQTSVTAGVDASEDEPVSNARNWGSLSTVEKVVTITIGVVVLAALIWGITGFITARFFHS